MCFCSRSEIRFRTVSVFGEAPTDIPAELDGLTLGEGSSQEDWKNLFNKCTEAREIILDNIDFAKIGELLSITTKIFGQKSTRCSQ